MLPEWAPNLHPLVVHFPIALLFLAVGFDFVTLLLRRPKSLVWVTAVLYGLGALGALVAYLTGRAAADGLDLPSSVIPAVSAHADWAERTLWFFGIFALIRLGLAWWRHPLARAGWLHGLLVAVGLGGLWLLYQTGERGAELVFAHGLGVSTVHELEAERDSLARQLRLLLAAAQFEQQPDGGWHWMPGPGAEQVLADSFTVHAGSLAELSLEAGPDELRLTLADQTLLFTGPGTLSGTEITVRLHRDSLQGIVRLVYHLQDANNYDFLEIGPARIRQGRLVAGQERLFDEAPLPETGWLEVRAIAYGTHFRGYVNGQMRVHGHGSAARPGPAGLYLRGSGTIRLRTLTVQPVH
ncbi:DUF2231 domain-containing protein [Rhodothermus profundi]|uniref:Uncharacterized membrane protein n=1 Tax=Rhodothermus profundi TaxID=633813 RepID=A0A1M6P9S3_9BACT|nr:DUF2231 domain-containing protein [Rhodothermus profundi]SHK04668.1 Uncharacterized membrane protein [Rhodothermus profundi]